jgi:hypothetical protein
MGERQKTPLRVGFDRGIKLGFHGPEIASVYRELDEAFNLTTSSPNQLADV